MPKNYYSKKYDDLLDYFIKRYVLNKLLFLNYKFYGRFEKDVLETLRNSLADNYYNTDEYYKNIEDIIEENNLVINTGNKIETILHVYKEDKRTFNYEIESNKKYMFSFLSFKTHKIKKCSNNEAKYLDKLIFNKY